MIEITMTELVLFCWAVLATGFMFKYRDEAKKHAFMVNLMLKDKKARDEIVSSFEEWQKENV
jgi:hypothetical protein